MTSASQHPRKVFPVIHHLNSATTLDQANMAFRAGADGVFLISHNGKNEDLFSPARTIKQRYPDKLVGLNLLGTSAVDALLQVAFEGLDMIWADAPGVTSAGLNSTGQLIEDWIALNPDGPRVFGSVAFKYQPTDPRPADAAHLAAAIGMLPTTSGSGTGSAPEVGKMASMAAALGGGELAVASGMSPENVSEFLPYVTHFLVATGVSTGMHHFDEARLTQFIKTVNAWRAADPTETGM